MSFISYAQNFEDVMLWRALKHIEHGFYIDVGAAFPDVQSVTLAFYDHGWKGINIEPDPELHRQLLESRPRDRNLCLAVSDSEGHLVMNFLEGAGLSTLDNAVAEKYQKTGLYLKRKEVQVTTLNNMWLQCVPTGQNVHFLKVDVEGAEEAVLRGNDWTKNRPWIVVVEATLPLSQVASYGTWEPILLSANYLFAYADGLNRFYVAAEHPEILSSLHSPPNYFDDFVLATQVKAEAKAQQAEAKVQQVEALLNAVYESRAWRWTASLRWIEKKLRLVE
ncbi:MAG: FkbM family methyltransferase [Smithellaceae bacterium]